MSQKLRQVRMTLSRKKCNIFLVKYAFEKVYSKTIPYESNV